MVAQRHLIKRQILELKVPAAEQTQSLYAEISRIHHQRIAPLIDQCCSGLTEPDQIHRIESLQLDLGHLDLKNLEESLITRLSERLPEALAQEIRRQDSRENNPGQNHRDKSRLELFEFFARTGSLPWWADRLGPQGLSDVLKHLIAKRPGGLVRVMRELGRRQQPLQRIVLHSRDETLAALCRLLAPKIGNSMPQLPQELAALFMKNKVVDVQTGNQSRKMIWLEILRTGLLQGAQLIDPVSFWRAVLVQIALTCGVTYVSLVSGIHRAVQTGTVKVSHALRDLAGSLYHELAGKSTDGKELIRILRRLQDPQGSLSSLFSLLQAIVGPWPNGLQAQLLAVLKRYENRGSDSEVVKGIIPVLRSALEQNPALSTPVGQRLVKLQKLPTPELSPEVLSGLTKMLREIVNVPAAVPYQGNVNATSIDLSFSDAAEFFIQNSGLVIFWPFLSSFFEQLGLMEKNKFKGEAAVQRAVGLLQYLVTEDSSPPEYLLPVNKVLCGMDPTSVFDFGVPVTPDEAEECRKLLNAVIAHAPILKDMSLSGLRGTFLLRKGMLGTRDGAWLLRVERESYDVVLDRFPWPLNWIKLPWMTVALRVEW
jgi:hypothetical protein